MAKVKNLLYQPLVLDFKEISVRFNSREIKEIDDKYLKTKEFKRNAHDLLVLKELDPLPKQENEVKQEMEQPKQEKKAKTTKSKK